MVNNDNWLLVIGKWLMADTEHDEVLLENGYWRILSLSKYYWKMVVGYS